jgi:hypothetical protein
MVYAVSVTSPRLCILRIDFSVTFFPDYASSFLFFSYDILTDSHIPHSILRHIESTIALPSEY